MTLVSGKNTSTFEESVANTKKPAWVAWLSVEESTFCPVSKIRMSFCNTSDQVYPVEALFVPTKGADSGWRTYFI